MKNRELIGTLNALYDARKREEERGKDEKVFTGTLLFAMLRNLRILEKEYNENYLKDLQAIKDKYYDTEEKEVVIPADVENRIEEHKEKQKIAVLKPEQTEMKYAAEINTLLDFEVDLGVKKVAVDEVKNIYDFRDMDAIQFMVE